MENNSMQITEVILKKEAEHYEYLDADSLPTIYKSNENSSTVNSNGNLSNTESKVKIEPDEASDGNTSYSLIDSQGVTITEELSDSKKCGTGSFAGKELSEMSNINCEEGLPDYILKCEVEEATVTSNLPITISDGISFCAARPHENETRSSRRIQRPLSNRLRKAERKIAGEGTLTVWKKMELLRNSKLEMIKLRYKCIMEQHDLKMQLLRQRHQQKMEECRMKLELYTAKMNHLREFHDLKLRK